MSKFSELDGLNVSEKTYHGKKCVSCGHIFLDGENYFAPRFDKRITVCQDCVVFALKELTSWNPHGSNEPAPFKQSWSWLRYLILRRDDWSCQIPNCKKPASDIHHIVPRRQGGSDHPKNLVSLCERHHHETFKLNYAGVQVTDMLIAEGKQATLQKQNAVMER